MQRSFSLALGLLLLFVNGVAASDCVNLLGGSCVTAPNCAAGEGGQVSNFCRDDPVDVLCCLDFNLRTEFAALGGSVSAGQRAALDGLQERLDDFTLYRDFACEFRGQTPDGTSCGSEISMGNVAQYYNPSLQQHNDALDTLQNALETSSLLRAAFVTFVGAFRNPAPPPGSCAKAPAASFETGVNGINVIRHFESFFPRCYTDSEGIWTIGYGHACHVNSNDGSGCLSGNACDQNRVLSEAEGAALLEQDISIYSQCVKDTVTAQITQNQFDVLTSFTFNAGCGALAGSTLVQRLNAGTLTPRDAQYWITVWNKGTDNAGRLICVEGLQRRRFLESLLWQSCDANFPCSEGSCQISYNWPKCVGGCAYCDDCGGCSGTAYTAPTSSTPAPVPTPKPTSPVPPPTVAPTQAPVDTSCVDSLAWQYSLLEGDLRAERLEQIRMEASGAPANLIVRRGHPSLTSIVVARRSGAVSSDIPVIVGQAAELDAEVPVERSAGRPVVVMQLATRQDAPTASPPPSASSITRVPLIMALVSTAFAAGMRNRNALVTLALLLGLVAAVEAQCNANDFFVEISLPTETYDRLFPERQQIVDGGAWTTVRWVSTPPGAPTTADCQDLAVQALFPAQCGVVAPTPDPSEGALLLTNVARFMDVGRFPHQGCAIDFLVDNLDAASYGAFSCDFRNQAGGSPPCGAGNVDFQDVAQFYNPSSAPHQATALLALQTRLERDQPQIWSQFVSFWRKGSTCVDWEVRADGRCGSAFGGAGCDPERVNSCCSPGGWCGSTPDHCDRPGSWDWKDGAPPPIDAAVLRGRPCDDGEPGVCVDNALCTSEGGSSISLKCRGLPANVRCCQNPTNSQPVYELEAPACKELHPTRNEIGVCVETSRCAALGGVSAPNACDGPSSVQCCAGDRIVPRAQLSGAACTEQHSSGTEGVCTIPADCTRNEGLLDDGKCTAGPEKCCAGGSVVPKPGFAVSGDCGDYAGAAVQQIEGNGGVIYDVTKILQKHLTTPSNFFVSPTRSDNTMTIETACAFGRMANEAARAGVRITIQSGFRTVARQSYFWSCFQCRLSGNPRSSCCNNGNTAAVPGTSNHGVGRSLDVNTNCPEQTNYNSPPAACLRSPVYAWLRANALRFGFARDVWDEPWHWSFLGARAVVQPYQ